ncbi:ribonuclease H-like domain-containing protein [Tanacetum coccineum]
MITRSQSGIVKLINRLSLNTFLIFPIPKNSSDALKDRQWRNAMYDEYNALHKFHADGTLSRYKARLVANGSSQQLGVDFDETFNPVVKPAIIRTVLSLAVSRKWPINQLDVKNAFLNGDLSKTVYMHQPPDFVDASFLNHFYGIILTASSPSLLQQIIDSLHNEFDMTDLGALNYFLGISVDRNSTSLFLSQRKYALQLLKRAHMVHCNPSRTPIDTESKLYLSYAVQQVCLYMHDPREPHFVALKRILRYVRGTVDFGLQLYASATTSRVGYTDADWAGFPSTRSAIDMSSNPVQHQQTKHIEIDIHFVHDMVTTGQVRVIHVPSRYQYVDIFTKGLPPTLFEEFHSSLSVHPPPASTARAY